MGPEGNRPGDSRRYIAADARKPLKVLWTVALFSNWGPFLCFATAHAWRRIDHASEHDARRSFAPTAGDPAGLEDLAEVCFLT